MALDLTPIEAGRWLDEARPEALRRQSQHVRSEAQYRAFERLNAEDEIVIRALTRRERHNPTQPDITGVQTRTLHGALWRAATRLKLEDSLVLPEDREKPPRTIGEYALTPLLQEDETFLAESFLSIKTYEGLLTRPGDVAFEYRRPGEVPVIDAAIAVGLVFRGRLVALCSGGFDVTGPLITQIQDVSNKQYPKATAALSPPDSVGYAEYCAYLDEVRKLPFRNGLRGGVEWRSTLVKAWSSVAMEALPSVIPELQGTPVHVQSARNNLWADPDIYDRWAQPTGRTDPDVLLMMRFTNEYDRVALRLGAELDQASGNYILPYTLPG